MPQWVSSQILSTGEIISVAVMNYNILCYRNGTQIGTVASGLSIEPPVDLYITPDEQLVVEYYDETETKQTLTSTDGGVNWA